MGRTKLQYLGIAAVAVVTFLAVWLGRGAAQQVPAAPKNAAADISGVVTSAKGPEAGVWVIAETNDLGTKFRRIVVTDDRGRYVIPDLPKAWSPVTILQLLNHTAGAPDYIHAAGWKENIRLERSPGELLKPVFQLPLEFVPGTKWKYSNSGYFLLGLVIEKVSGESYANFLSQRIFQPLNMTSTKVGNPRDLISNRAAGYIWNGVLLNDEYVSPSQKWAAGAVVSTAADLAKWAQSLENESLLGHASLQAMLAPARLATGENAPYGLGNELDTDHRHRLAGHQGGGIGFNAAFLNYPDDHLAVVVLANLRGANALQLARHIAGFVLPELSDEDKSGIADDPKLTQALAGVLKAAAQGKVDPAVINPDVQAKLIPFLEQTGPRFLGRLGELRSFTLIEEATDAPNRDLRYRAKFDRGTVIWTFKLDAMNRIVSLEPRPE